MTSLADLLAQGAGHAWLFIPSAILLGALHGLEPGHSKTMMAAFIVAIRGTVWQAVLLGLSATISHTAIVWAIAMGGVTLGQNVDAEASEPYFQLASAGIMLAIAAWMAWRTWREQAAHAPHHHGHQDHRHDGDHSHDEVQRIDTSHGVAHLEIYETGAPPRWRLRFDGHGWPASDVELETERADGARQPFHFVARDGYLESIADIAEPHDFIARLKLGHGGHVHTYDVIFIERPYAHGHDPVHDEARALDAVTGGAEDAHALAHANDIRRRFAGRNVTTGQIVVFGLTGGLIPCPAAITVLLLCLQLKRIALGATLVLSFSIGLAITMVAAGVIAALSMRHVERRWSGIGTLARNAPYISSILIITIALFVGYGALRAIAGA
ncbi:MAG: nickel/cobalt efflux transporter [Hyphomonadaceae bacterium]|nr:nickel/cobalt efflux transporter [Hyphomonadaceae bacterium]